MTKILQFNPWAPIRPILSTFARTYPITLKLYQNIEGVILIKNFKEKNLVWGQITNLGSFEVKFKISLEMGKARSSRNLGQPTTSSEVRGLNNLCQPITSSDARALRDGKLSEIPKAPWLLGVTWWCQNTPN